MKHPCIECNRFQKGCNKSCMDMLEYNVMYKKSVTGKYSGSHHESKASWCHRMAKRKATTKEWLTGQNISYTAHIRSDVAVNCL